MKLAIGCDEAAYSMKKEIINHLKQHKNLDIIDCGSQENEVVLYPDIAKKVCDTILIGNAEKGILLCGTGIGMAISANKIPGIRAAVCHDIYSTERSRRSNNVQIMCMGARVIGLELAKMLVDHWLQCNFDGGKSEKKVKRIMELEKEY